LFLYGAYKKPRDATWLAGGVWLRCSLTYGLTGYLLPWDNRAYWGTVVTTQIATKTPLMGPYLDRLLGGDGAIGVVTFARFYTLHVLLLPLATTFLIALHVYLVRKHGVAPAPGDAGATKKFFPGQFFKDTVAIFVAFAALFVMAVFAQAPLGRLADPTDITLVPRPEWYFLFLFQMLKVFEGPLEVVGSTLLPMLAILALISVPFVDRGRLRRLRDRTAAFGVVALALIGWTGLTLTALVSSPTGSPAAEGEISGPGAWQQLSPEELAGIGYFRQEACASCHNLGPGPAKIGPNLGAAATGKSAAWMIDHFKRPSQMVPGSAMPAIQLNDSQLNALAAFLLKLTPQNARALEAAPAFAVDGALTYQTNRCGVCHTVNGVGMRVGPVLNGLAQRRSREWVEKHFLDPQAVSPGSIMPPYKFAPREMERIVGYLLALP